MCVGVVKGRHSLQEASMLGEAASSGAGGRWVSAILVPLLLHFSGSQTNSTMKTRVWKYIFNICCSQLKYFFFNVLTQMSTQKKKLYKPLFFKSNLIDSYTSESTPFTPELRLRPREGNNLSQVLQMVSS